MESFIRGLPKVELHVHIEGTLEPRLMLELAARNGVDLPYPDEAAIRQAYAFTDLQSFLDLYYAGMRVLQTERDFHDLTWAYLMRASVQNVRHVEVFFDPQAHTERGLSLQTVLRGVQAGLCRGREELGITSGLIPCFLRHLGGEAASQTWEQLLPHRDEFIGVGLDSSERDYPPELFVDAFAKARAAGLHVVAHAGEEGPAAFIRTALDQLGAERIDHGVRCLEDPALVEELVRRKIPLTVCPLSNVRLKVFSSIEQHNLRRLLDAGLRVTINSDDPAYFGGYMNENYLAVARGLGLGRAEVQRLAADAIDASFAPDDRKQALHRELAEYVALARKSERPVGSIGRA